jgi:tetratricopeptide (TPR) repeat protein
MVKTVQHRVAEAVLALGLATSLAAATPRVTFERVIPAAHAVGADDIAILQAIGDHASVETFVEVVVEQVNKSHALRMTDLRRGRGTADAYLNVRAFTCQTTMREGEGSRRDPDNKRVKRLHRWADAVCSARVELLSKSMRRLETFHVRGEGTSPRVEIVGEDERNIALEQAARYAAIAAAERITPRRVRETVILDEKAPVFDEGMSMIESGRLREARTIWTEALRTYPRSAQLHYNLAAVCEAQGDRPAAEEHYRAARDLAPNESRYSLELRMFQKRGP